MCLPCGTQGACARAKTDIIATCQSWWYRKWTLLPYFILTIFIAVFPKTIAPSNCTNVIGLRANSLFKALTDCTQS